jgi:hypothetical protein
MAGFSEYTDELLGFIRNGISWSPDKSQLLKQNVTVHPLELLLHI